MWPLFCLRLRFHLTGFADFSPCGILGDCLAETWTSTSGASSAKPSCSKVSFLDADAKVADDDAPANDNDAADVAHPLLPCFDLLMGDVRMAWSPYVGAVVDRGSLTTGIAQLEKGSVEICTSKIMSKTMGVDCQPLAKNGWHARDSLSVPMYVRVDKKINNHAQYNGAHAHPPYPQVYLRSMVLHSSAVFVGSLVGWLLGISAGVIWTHGVRPGHNQKWWVLCVDAEILRMKHKNELLFWGCLVGIARILIWSYRRLILLEKLKKVRK